MLVWDRHGVRSDSIFAYYFNAPSYVWAFSLCLLQHALLLSHSLQSGNNVDLTNGLQVNDCIRMTSI